MPTIDPHFAEQRDGEIALLKTRRHWWAFLRSAWIPLLLLLGLWAGAALADDQTLSIALFAASLLLPGIALLYGYAEWRNDSIIVSDQRIIRIDRGILAMRQQISQVGLESVQEINYDIPSGDVFARIFRYGTVFVKTAGAQGNMELDLVPHPARFQKLIIEDRHVLEERRAQTHQALVRSELSRMLEEGDDAGEREHKLDPASPPTPLPGSNGYLSARIEMSNGDIVYRKHISVWAQHTILPLLIILLSLTGMLFTFAALPAEARVVGFAAAMVAMLFGCVSYYWMDWDWRNDIYVIADDTITLVRKRPFFLQNIRDQILMERIDNVESSRSGLFAALFKYGEVSMSLVGADEPKRFERVANPRAIQQEISRRQHNKSLRRARQDAQLQREVLTEFMGAAEGNGGAASRSDHGGARAARNLDRNRPPRLPRKVVEYSSDVKPGQRIRR